jgi:PPOX class probable F420-dependent enzyme
MMAATFYLKQEFLMPVESSVIPESHADLVERPVLAHVATLGPNGEPQNNPVWFDMKDGLIRFSQTTARQKYRNVQRDGRAAFSIVDPDNPYRYLEIRATLERIEPDPDYAFINSMAKKYLNEDRYPWLQPGEERVVLYFRPEHTSQMG